MFGWMKNTSTYENPFSITGKITFDRTPPFQYESRFRVFIRFKFVFVYRLFRICIATVWHTVAQCIWNKMQMDTSTLLSMRNNNQITWIYQTLQLSVSLSFGSFSFQFSIFFTFSIPRITVGRRWRRKRKQMHSNSFVQFGHINLHFPIHTSWIFFLQHFSFFIFFFPVFYPPFLSSFRVFLFLFQSIQYIDYIFAEMYRWYVQTCPLYKCYLVRTMCVCVCLDSDSFCGLLWVCWKM